MQTLDHDEVCVSIEARPMSATPDRPKITAAAERDQRALDSRIAAPHLG